MKTMRTGGKSYLTVLAILAVFHSGSAVLWAAPDGVLRAAVHWTISADCLDPSTASYSAMAHLPLYLLHDALVKPMSEGIYTPCLAESYSISKNLKVYEFKLRKGAKFHNGDIMDADDVVFSFWRYKGAKAKFIHEKVEKVEAVNPNLVRFYFKEPFPNFIEHLAPGVTTIGWVVPQKYVKKVGDEGLVLEVLLEMYQKVQVAKEGQR